MIPSAREFLVEGTQILSELLNNLPVKIVMNQADV